MQEVKRILNELRLLSGNAQIDCLSLYKDNITLKEVLIYTYDPLKKYKIDQLKYFKTGNNVSKLGFFNLKQKRILEQSDWNTFKIILDELVIKRSAKDADVRRVIDFIDCFSEDDQQILLGVLFKDLRLNMNINKFQKVWFDLCCQPQVQLANLYAGKDFYKGYYSRKFDGKRMYIKENLPYSRANRLCKIKPIEHILSQVAHFSDMVLDGELIFIDEEGNEDFQRAISLTSSDERNPDCDNLYYVIFDMIPKNLFMTKDVYVAFEDEYNLILETFGCDLDYSAFNNYSLLKTEYPNILVARQDTNIEIMQQLREKYNWEGLMYRNGEACYEYKRTNNLLKMKRMKDGEFEIINLLIGSGKHEGRLGTLNIKLPSGEIVGVGSGFTDEQRDLFWKNKELIESNDFKSKYLAKVQFFETTANKDGSNSLRFPVFLAFRNKQTGEEFTSLTFE